MGLTIGVDISEPSQGFLLNATTSHVTREQLEEIFSRQFRDEFPDDGGSPGIRIEGKRWFFDVRLTEMRTGNAIKPMLAAIGRFVCRHVPMNHPLDIFMYYVPDGQELEVIVQ